MLLFRLPLPVLIQIRIGQINIVFLKSVRALLHHLFGQRDVWNGCREVDSPARLDWNVIDPDVNYLADLAQVFYRENSDRRA